MEAFAELWERHSYWLIPLVWLVLSALLNMALRKRTAEQWVSFAESRPRSAALVRLLRALGLDPVKAVLALKHLVNGKAMATRRALPEPAAKALEVVAAVEGAEPPKDDKEKPCDEPQPP